MVSAPPPSSLGAQSNTSTKIRSSSFVDNQALGSGGCFRANGTNSRLEVSKSSFTGNLASYGAVVSLGQNHSVRLVSSKIANNVAFAGSLMHLGNDTLNATRQVETAQLFLKGNQATVGALSTGTALQLNPSPSQFPCVQ